MGGGRGRARDRARPALPARGPGGRGRPRRREPATTLTGQREQPGRFSFAEDKVLPVLSLVLPKGSLERATLDLFDAADLTVRRSSDRDYHASIDDPRIDKVRFLRPQEIPSYIERGLFDLGITGRDCISETGAEVVSLGELQYSKVSSNPARIVLAVPQGAPWQTIADLPEGIRISTEYPSLTSRFLEERGVKAMVIRSYGATEAKVPDIVDAIVDLTETGSSLRKNGLRILDTLLS